MKKRAAAAGPPPPGAPSDPAAVGPPTTGHGPRSFRTLGIETSCDETAVSVLAGDGGVRFALISSQA
ncbi:MAG TPA: hypothetical protein VLW17_12540, partial [Thermoanaerobaculaceae bacterium]|nr:hypothetical protein [Thermoanaerobaculaceae bacterium]